MNRCQKINHKPHERHEQKKRKWETGSWKWVSLFPISNFLFRLCCQWLIFFVFLSGAVFAQENPYRPPLYWSVYEYHFLLEKQGVQDNYIPEDVFLANINWVEKELKPHGFDMVCVDGWGDDWYARDEHGYRTTHSRHWKHNYAWWANFLRQNGMSLGIYDNPLWVSRMDAEAGKLVEGTDIPISAIIDVEEKSAFGFTWVQVDRPGAEEYVKGNVRHYAGMGVKFLRVDFLSWYETGWEDNWNGGKGGVVGRRDRPHEHYETALRWIREACDEGGIYLSLVMPNLHNEGEVERRYGRMYRVNEDSAEGGWWRFSENGRGMFKANFSRWRNPFDGFIYWSRYSGVEAARPDGDFIRLNTYANDEERKAVMSLMVMAGGPVAITDQYNTIGGSLWVAQNDELLSLALEGFAGKPLSPNPLDSPASEVWTGTAANGDKIAAFFNRGGSDEARWLDFPAALGIPSGSVRDVWAHEELGSRDHLVVNVPAHGCRVFRISNRE